MQAISLFAGIGGFDIALEGAGVEVILQSEIEPHCQEVLGKHFPGTELIPDVRDVRDRQADIVVGGFPCQDISVAGNRAGLAGERSGLWREHARVLDEVRPTWCIIENVAGLLTSNGGRDLGTILGALGEMGYGFAYRVLDAQWFGVPQRRRRVFIVGCLGDYRRAAQVLLEPEGGRWDPPTRGMPWTLASALTANGLGGGSPDDNLAQANHLIPAVASTLAARMAKGVNTNQVVDNDGDGHLIPAYNNVRTFASDGEVDEYYLPTDISNALHVSHSNKRVTVVQQGARKLMPVECERLQGFPDGWTEGHADTQRYRMLGNAVAVPVVEWIVDRLVLSTSSACLSR